MSGTYSNSNSNTFTEARATYVLGKIKDDFINIAYRGFSTVTSERLMKWWADVAFVVNAQALRKCELQFRWVGGEAALIYEVVADGSIHVDGESATHDFHQIPAAANVSIVIDRDPNNEKAVKYLVENDWGGIGTFLAGLKGGTNGYSISGYGFTIKTIGL